jgi:hypothetical protein
MNSRVSGRGLRISYGALLDFVDPQSQASRIALQTSVCLGDLDVLGFQQELDQRLLLCHSLCLQESDDDIAQRRSWPTWSPTVEIVSGGYHVPLEEFEAYLPFAVTLSLWRVSARALGPHQPGPATGYAAQLRVHPGEIRQLRTHLDGSYLRSAPKAVLVY